MSAFKKIEKLQLNKLIKSFPILEINFILPKIFTILGYPIYSKEYIFIYFNYKIYYFTIFGQEREQCFN